MKGFIVKTKFGEERDILKVALPNGAVSISVEMLRGGKMCGIGGLTEDGVYISWKGGGLQAGDEIEVEFADVEESPFPVWQETHSSLVERMTAVADKEDDEETLRYKLERYHRLKAILEAEGLIE